MSIFNRIPPVAYFVAILWFAGYLIGGVREAEIFLGYSLLFIGGIIAIVMGMNLYAYYLDFWKNREKN